MKSKTKWTFDKQRRSSENWLLLDEQQAVVFDEVREEMGKSISEHRHRTLRERMAIYSDLAWQASWPISVGAVQILRGDSAGWVGIRHGLVLSEWSIRIRHALIDKEQCWDNSPYNVSLFDERSVLSFLHSIATGDDVFAHGFGKKLIHNFEKFHGGDKVFAYVNPVFPFALKLYCQWVGHEITFRDDVPDPLGPYQALFDAWNSIGDLPAALEAMVQFHCGDSIEKHDVLSQVFIFNPYNIFPVELLALYRIRTELGLGTPEINHPLMQSPLAEVPKQIPEVHDELLDRVIEFVRADFPGLSLADPW